MIFNFKSTNQKQGMCMRERGRYRTRQQETILECLKKHRETFSTVDQFMECLRQEGIQVGQTTLYRALDRMTEDGLVLKIPSVDGSKAQYRYVGDAECSHPGKLVCLKCGRIIPLECGQLQVFERHIYEDHHFKLDRRQLVFYGCCAHCSEQKRSDRLEEM